MRVIVCGGRSFDNEAVAFQWLDALHGIYKFALVIHGAAIGADALAEQWAYRRHVDIAKYPANWKAHKKAAGPIRNKQMIDEGKPDLVIAFPGGRGTSNMMMQARDAGLPVINLAEAGTRRQIRDGLPAP